MYHFYKQLAKSKALNPFFSQMQQNLSKWQFWSKVAMQKNTLLRVNPNCGILHSCSSLYLASISLKVSHLISPDLPNSSRTSQTSNQKTIRCKTPTPSTISNSSGPSPPLSKTVVRCTPTTYKPKHPSFCFSQSKPPKYITNIHNFHEKPNVQNDRT